MSQGSENRAFSKMQIRLCGLVVGAASYLVAEMLTPQNGTPQKHDLVLASILGFVYTPLVGIWLGWIQKSWRRAFVGAIVGIVIGIFYTWLCSIHQFFLIMVAFPCLLGGVLAGIVGSNGSLWKERLANRTAKGLVAGLLFGFIYAVVLNVTGFFAGGWDLDDANSYIRMMWHAGPVALGSAGAVFFVRMLWAVELSDVIKSATSPSWSQHHPRYTAAIQLILGAIIGITLRLVFCWYADADDWARTTISSKVPSIGLYRVSFFHRRANDPFVFDLLNRAATLAKEAYGLEHASELLTQGILIGVVPVVLWRRFTPKSNANQIR